MNKTMYISFIIIGAVLIVVGVVGMVRSSAEQKEIDSTPQYIAAEQLVDTLSEEPRRVDTIREMTETIKTVYVIEKSEAPDNKPQQNEAVQLTEKEKGNLFEGYVADCFKDRRTFKVLEWNQGVTSPEGVYAESNLNPDFHIEQVYTKDFNIDYYIEAKYLSRWKPEGTIQLNDYQIERYRRHQGITHRKVILAIGIGGVPDSPADFYFVPLDSVSGSELSKSFLDSFSISQSSVKEYILNYFRNGVFKKSSLKKDKE